MTAIVQLLSVAFRLFRNPKFCLLNPQGTANSPRTLTVSVKSGLHGLLSTPAFQQAEMRLMENSKYFRFGELMSKLRVARATKQIAIAAATGITEARINKFERGRIVGPGREAVLRIAVAMGLSDSETSALLEASAHDRCMREITRNFSKPYQLDLLATALDVARINSAEDCQALVDGMRLLAGGRKGVNAFKQTVEEAAMT